MVRSLRGLLWARCGAEEEVTRTQATNAGYGQNGATDGDEEDSVGDQHHNTWNVIYFIEVTITYLGERGLEPRASRPETFGDRSGAEHSIAC